MADQILWIEPSGGTHLLTDNDTVNVLVGPAGLFAPPADLISDAVPLRAGTRLRGVRTQAREVDLPLFIQAPDEASLRMTIRDISRWFDPNRGDGRLRFVTPAGAVRDLVCRVPRGLQYTEDPGRTRWYAPPSIQALATFYAGDPYFVGATPVAATYAVSVPTVGFPYPPIVLAASSIIASATEINPGDIEAQPVWTITGPGQGVTLTNVTTGESLAVGRNLLAGDTVVIDTRYGYSTVSLAATNDLYPDLSGSLWWLQPGANVLAIDMPNASPASSIALSYQPKFRTI